MEKVLVNAADITLSLSYSLMWRQFYIPSKNIWMCTLFHIF